MGTLYMAISKMGDAGVSVKGMGMIDLAMNKAKIEPAILEYEKMRRLPERIQQYNRKLSTCKTPEERVKLFEAFSSDIEAYDKREIELTDLNDGERVVDLLIIKRDQLVIDEKNGKAAEVLFGLLPVIETEK